jgi:hypothetical protein
MAREEERWQRLVVDKTGNKEAKEIREQIKVPESYDLGLDKRGNALNSSKRRCHDFTGGTIFERQDGKKGESRNWTATFIRASCVSCRNKSRMLNHRGRSEE